MIPSNWRTALRVFTSDTAPHQDRVDRVQRQLDLLAPQF